jgi:branched-chain amino acid transport system substrate-binding protein
MRRYAVIALGLAVALLTASSSAVAAAAPARVELPTLLSVTGSAAYIGKEALESVRLVVAQRNADGGVRGRLLDVALTDTGTQPLLALQAMNQIKAKSAAAVFGPTFTAVCNAVEPIVKDGPVVSCFSPGVHPKPGSFMFSAGVGSGGMAQALATYFNDRNWQRIGMISSIDASGQDFETQFDRVMAQPENARLHLVAREHFNVSDLSVAAQMARIKAANPQVVIVWTAGTGLGVALHGIKQVGLNVPVVAGNGNMVRSQLSNYSGFIPATLLFPGLLGMTPATDAPAAVRAAQTKYFAAYATTGAKPDLPGALSWDPTEILLDAYQALGWDATPEQLRDWISSQHAWAGINGIYDFAAIPQRGIGVDSCVIDRWDETAKTFVPVSAPGGHIAHQRRVPE